MVHYNYCAKKSLTDIFICVIFIFLNFSSKQFNLIGVMISTGGGLDFGIPKINNKKIYARYLIRQAN